MSSRIAVAGGPFHAGDVVSIDRRYYIGRVERVGNGWIVLRPYGWWHRFLCRLGMRPLR